MRWIKDLIALVFPSICPACNKRICVDDHLICLHCAIQLKKTDQHRLKVNEFTQKFVGRVPLHSATARYYYAENSVFRNLIYALKYKNRYDIGYKIGVDYGKDLRGVSWFEDVDCIIPVPLHKSKLKKRSYNQSEAFARGLSCSMNIPCKVDWLKRQKNTPSQTQMTRYERLENMNEAFTFLDKGRPLPNHVLLVDDIITTGSTLEACAQVLLSNGVSKISMACIAMALD